MADYHIVPECLLKSATSSPQGYVCSSNYKQLVHSYAACQLAPLFSFDNIVWFARKLLLRWSIRLHYETYVSPWTANNLNERCPLLLNCLMTCVQLDSHIQLQVVKHYSFFFCLYFTFRLKTMFNIVTRVYLFHTNIKYYAKAIQESVCISTV